MSLAEGESLKAEGQQLALQFSGIWRDAIVAEFIAWAALRKLRGERTFAVEQFRSEAKNMPPSSKAWGALPAVLTSHGLIEPEPDGFGGQRYIKATSARTHSHRVAMWRLRDCWGRVQ